MTFAPTSTGPPGTSRARSISAPISPLGWKMSQSSTYSGGVRDRSAPLIELEVAHLDVQLQGLPAGVAQPHLAPGARVVTPL